MFYFKKRAGRLGREWGVGGGGWEGRCLKTQGLILYSGSGGVIFLLAGPEFTL